MVEGHCYMRSLTTCIFCSSFRVNLVPIVSWSEYII